MEEMEESEEEMMEEMEESEEEEMEESDEEEMEDNEEEESLEAQAEADHGDSDRPVRVLMTPPGSQRRSAGLYVQSEVDDDFVIVAHSSDTVDSLKMTLHDILGTPPDQQRLRTSAGVLMENGRTLADYDFWGLEHISVTREGQAPPAG